MPQSSVINGGVWALARMSLPLFLFLFCESVAAFGERVLLSAHGIEAVSSALNGSYLASLFQGCCVAIASMAQVFVGLYQGKEELKRIGPCVWQLVWFSLLSLLVTLPLSLWGSSLYFKGTAIEQMGSDYFFILMLGNALFPLNTALMSFHLGRGKTLFVTWLLLGGYALHLVLCGSLVDGLGVSGTALAKCLSMGVIALILWGSFLKKKYREVYGTTCWRLSWGRLWTYIRPGFIRAFVFFWMRMGWLFISSMMIKKGGDYLQMHMVGGVITAFLSFIALGIYKSTLTIVSNLLGRRDYTEIGRFCRSLVLYVVVIGLALAIPVLFYPHSLTYFFDSASQSVCEEVFITVKHWIWLYAVVLAIQMGLSGVLVAMQELKMQLYTAFLTTFTSVLPVYLIVHLGEWGPEKLWVIAAVEEVVLTTVLIGWILRKTWQIKFLAQDAVSSK